MKALLMTNEYPPNIYGGAGVNVEYLSKSLAKLCKVEVRCFKTPEENLPANLTAKCFNGFSKEKFSGEEKLFSVFNAIQKCVNFNAMPIDANIVHCHTWYTHLAGIFAKKIYNIPLVLTSHSLEPLRSWKREQLGGGYDFSLWVEKTAIEMSDAIIAVSESMKNDIIKYFNLHENKIHIIHNGIDLNEFTKQTEPKTLTKYGIQKDKGYILFVGRITRQKGIDLLLDAIKLLPPSQQVVLCASAPDTPEIDKEVKQKINDLRAQRNNESFKDQNRGIIWINTMISNQEKIHLYSSADVFCCPSIYEPFGITNIEAFACETPVVASAVGGIVEIIDHNENGFLIPVDAHADKNFSISNRELYIKNLAKHLEKLCTDKKMRNDFGKRGREKTEKKFSWDAIAQKTFNLYQALT